MAQKFISIDSQLRNFKKHLDSNNRCIFSARFGDGKSYFLSKFIEKYSKQYLFIPIYPVNYQVADNRDIFEYIKRDILIRLLASGEIEIDDTTISNSIYLYYYLHQNGIDISADLLSITPEINLNGTDISLSAFGLAIKTFKKIKNKFEEYKSKFKNEEQKAEEFINTEDKVKGSIYEFDIISQLICDLVLQYKTKFKNRRKVVLLIEDLDRIDPAHIFRILNIFSAHFDRYNVGYTEVVKTKGENKFNFDKIVTVCHYENIRKIYSHLYGTETDFNGYIHKFSSHAPFYYSLTSQFKQYILDNLDIRLLKHKIVCDTICDLILDKYTNNLDGCIKSNLRHIDASLKQYIPIEEKYIQIQENFKISTNNELTSFLSILQKFDISWDNVVQRLIDNKKDGGHSELIRIIGCCWLSAKFFDKKFNFTYQESKNVITCNYEGYAYTAEIKTPIEGDLIKNLDINEIKDNQYLNSTYVVLKRKESDILSYFNSFLNNHREYTVR